VTTTTDRISFRSHNDWLKHMAERFVEDVKDHRLTIHLDDGPRRHLSIQEPGTSQYWYEVVTWHGVLTIRGDMGTFVFSRLDDMFQFFRKGPGYINPMYWAEKLQAHEVHGGHRQFSSDRFLQHVSESAGYWVDDSLDRETDQDQIAALHDALAMDVVPYSSYEEEARHAVEHFRFDDREVFSDIWEWDLTEYTAQFLWCCHAIVHAIAMYDAVRADGLKDCKASTAMQTVPTGGLL
jgi:hypothetical protein